MLCDDRPMWLRRLLASRRDRRSPLFTKEMLRQNVKAAARHGVESVCHPQDFIYNFIVTLPDFRTVGAAVDYYFDDGARSAKTLENLLAELHIEHRPIRLLEFASGYGCVTRHLKRYPAFSLVSCDIHPQAIEFLTRKLGVRAVMSAHTPEELSLGEAFDVVCALSFFSHMPRTTWGRWLRVLFSQVRPGGYLIFTTLGLASVGRFRNPEIPPDGFWFTTWSSKRTSIRPSTGRRS
jgi:SAM-dependent methyltransferase